MKEKLFKNRKLVNVLIIIVMVSGLISGCKKESARPTDIVLDTQEAKSSISNRSGKPGTVLREEPADNGTKSSSGDIRSGRELFSPKEDSPQSIENQAGSNKDIGNTENFKVLCRDVLINGEEIAGGQKESLEKIARMAALLHYGKDDYNAPYFENGEVRSYSYDSLTPEQEAFFSYEILDEKSILEDYFGKEWGYISDSINKDDIFNILSGVFPYSGSDFWNYSVLFNENKENEITINYADGDPWFEFRTAKAFSYRDFYLLKAPILYGDNGGGESFIGYMDCLFEKSDISPLGAILLFSELEYRGYSNIAIGGEATSNLPAANGKTYVAGNLIDGNFSTAWCEGVAGNGEGEQIVLDLGNVQEINGLVVYNGYLASGKLFNSNGKARTVRIQAGGLDRIYDLNIRDQQDTDFPLGSDYTGTVISFDSPVYDTEVIITLESAIAGTKYQDTCISEIQVY